MSGTPNISSLSYKELQALALRYRVPGNIKKQLLIEVLQAARCGNEQEVNKLLTDLRQNRKKRIRKGKPAKLTMSLASTPIHSPNYDMAEDYYAHQHRLPYQWVGAEEEIPNRQDESNRVPQYEEFRQFLLRRIQRDYQTYNTDHNDKVEAVDPAVIMDLRNDHQGDPIRYETDPQAGVRSHDMVPLNSLEPPQTYSEQITQNNAQFDYHILDDPNGNGKASILLRRMLQAPVGADLGVIASPELGSSCRVWGADYNQNENNNILDNSDTVSANSDINGNDDNNWPTGTEYYRFVNNVRDQLILNSGHNQSRTFHDQPAGGQFCNTITDNNPVSYQLLYSNQITDLQQQHGQHLWEATGGPFDNDPMNYQKLKNHGPKVFPALNTAYYDEIAAVNYATPRPMETDPLQSEYQNEDGSTVAYSGNQNRFEGNNSSASAPSRTEMKFYQNLNNNGSMPDPEPETPIPDVYSSLQHPARQINAIHSTGFYTPATGETMQQMHAFVPPMQNIVFTSQHQMQPPVTHNGYLEHLGCSSSPVHLTTQPALIEEFNRQPTFGQYNNTINKGTALLAENQEIYQTTENRGNFMEKRELVEGETETQNKTILGSTSTTQSDNTTSLDPFWPQRSAGPNTTENCLENILNLNAYGYVDYSKIDQTSCIYCYSAPVVTQRLFTANSSCSQKKRFIAEFRQHTFSPYWLLYNDTNTGMQMAKEVTAANETRKFVEGETMGTSVNEATNIPRDVEDSQNINASECVLEKQKLNSGAPHLVPITAGSNVTDICMKSGVICSNGASNDQNETQSTINFNMENVGLNDELQNDNCDSIMMTELSKKSSAPA